MNNENWFKFVGVGDEARWVYSQRVMGGGSKDF